MQHSSSTFTHLMDLKNSPVYEDQSKVVSLFTLLNKITDVVEPDRVYIVSKKNETIENQRYLLDNWKTLRKVFDLPTRLKKNQKFVSHVIKYIINQINLQYQLTDPIEMTNKQKSQFYRDELHQIKERKITFTEIVI